LVDELDSEIESLLSQLQLKNKQREMYLLERGVYEKQIDQVRSKYVSQINKYSLQREKLQRKQDKIEDDDLEYQREIVELKEYEDHFKSKLTQLEQELEDIVSLEDYLKKSHDELDNTFKKKKASLEK
jgi:uncharacterized protein YigA (DUF484 family)